ncbi:hypothetical protein ACF07W_20260 [Streptomyces sp. NPDC015140]|uniref:hypothetical protein n=1 Tax=Streptomyces TaxID=1883 RepID=UPI0036F911C2
MWLVKTSECYLMAPRTVSSSVNDPADLPAADLAIVATTSDLHRVAGTLLPLLERSYKVLSISEELAYPWQSHPGLARRLDDTAKAHGVTVLGSGANPGLLLGTLPLLGPGLARGHDFSGLRRRHARRKTSCPPVFTHLAEETPVTVHPLTGAKACGACRANLDANREIGNPPPEGTV